MRLERLEGSMRSLHFWRVRAGTEMEETNMESKFHTKKEICIPETSNISVGSVIFTNIYFLYLLINPLFFHRICVIGKLLTMLD